MLKVTTLHGTYYLIDLIEGKAKRVRGEGRGEMLGDGEWFSFSGLHSYDRDTNTHGDEIEVGKSMFFTVNGPRDYDWRISSNVSSIEEAEHDS